MDWVALDNDRASLNGRPVLCVRQRTETGAAGEVVAAVFMNKVAEPGLLDAESHARLIALAPRFARFIALLFENGCAIPPSERSSALSEAMDLHGALTGESDRYRGPTDGFDEGDGSAGDKATAAA